MKKAIVIGVIGCLASMMSLRLLAQTVPQDDLSDLRDTVSNYLFRQGTNDIADVQEAMEARDLGEATTSKTRLRANMNHSSDKSKP